MSTDPGTGSTRNTLIAVAYGTVESVQQVAMKPNYAEGSIIGGALGLLAASGYSSGSQALGAAAGAAVGAAYPDMHASVQNDSADCAAAKQDLLKASTEQEANIGYKKMQALCGN